MNKVNHHNLKIWMIARIRTVSWKLMNKKDQDQGPTQIRTLTQTRDREEQRLRIGDK